MGQNLLPRCLSCSLSPPPSLSVSSSFPGSKFCSVIFFFLLLLSPEFYCYFCNFFCRLSDDTFLALFFAGMKGGSVHLTCFLCSASASSATTPQCMEGTSVTGHFQGAALSHFVETLRQSGLWVPSASLHKLLIPTLVELLKHSCLPHLPQCPFTSSIKKIL